MFLRNEQVFNIDQAFVDQEGTQYPPGFLRNADQELLTSLGITEVPDPLVPNADFYSSAMQSDGTLLIVEKPLDECKKILKSKVSARRFQAETGGILINGYIIKTDLESQTKIGNTYTSLKNNLINTVNFKTANGFVTLDAIQFEAIAQAVSQHIQACYNNEASLISSIYALTDVASCEAFDINSGFTTV